MKIQIIKQELLKILLLAQDISEKNYNNSYYSYIIFLAKNNVITIKSANRQTTFQQIIKNNEYTKLEIFEEGEYLIPSTKLYDFVNSLHEGLIVFTSEKLNLKITEENTKQSDIEFNLKMKNLEDYPKDIHKTIDKELCFLKKNEMLQLIKNTSFAVSSNLKDFSMFLTGVYLDIKDNFLTAVATDRNRMSISKTMVENISILKKNYENDIIIPLKSLLFLRKILLKFEENIDFSLAVDEERIFFSFENINISANLISGKYYDYQRIIPKEKRNRIILDTFLLREAILRVIVANDNKKENNVLCKIENNYMVVSAEEKEKSKARESIPATVEGEEKEFLIKAAFLLDPLQIIESKQVYIDYGENVRDLIKITAVSTQDTIHIAAQLTV